MDQDDVNARGLSRHHILTAVEESLSRLRTDYIDLYQARTELVRACVTLAPVILAILGPIVWGRSQ